MLLTDLRAQYRKALAGNYQEEEIDSIFFRLLEHFLGLPRFIIGLEPKRFLLREEEEPLLQGLNRLLQGEPVQYITGKAFFMDLELAVGPGVLIPRPETEELVMWALEILENRPKPVILDAGTGSGCIALALASALPAATVHALEISTEALRLARQNNSQLDLEVAFHQGDMCDPPDLPKNLDLLISNPPYIPDIESESLDKHVREFEPHQALFSPDDNPLKFYKCLAKMGLEQLKPEAFLLVETHYQYAREVAAIFETAGYRDIQVKNDIFGKERMVCAVK
ncbi:release factor glutamine methyltransferase [Robiginitalea myxolifaciens]|uniref:Release factor glutamine methyltransferase n=1 Tax=Robiginitalea myxolifaciens TaxID=400055 RepID=A0A1I6GS78_9FLAO|nr:peptide chain release factor N(5)-glutamine methyltransferase [Robiginitalea myxolifaciens]SFR44969.1 release factor glutamine methyltransferase [Robiginitalea myxolifaciens]